MATVIGVTTGIHAGPTAAFPSAAVRTRGASRPTDAVGRSFLALATRVTTASGAGACVTDVCTYSVHTASARRAGVSALATVLVGAQVDAGPLAAGLTRLAGDAASNEATVAGVTAGIHAGPTAAG